MGNDLISRQAAIAHAVPLNLFGREVMMVSVSELENLPSVQSEQRWIPCSERLPRPYEQVLRTVKSFGWNCTPHTHVDIGTICPIDTDVIAWMPLPEPYKSESEGE